MTKFNPDRFDINQFEASDTATRKFGETHNSKWLNRSGKAEQINGKALWEHCLLPIYDLFHRPPHQATLYINSWFRNAAVNDAVGSKKTSQHKTGQACDFWILDWPAKKVFELLYENQQIFKKGFDQLILEYNNWIHISYRRPELGTNGREVLIINNSGKHWLQNEPK